MSLDLLRNKPHGPLITATVVLHHALVFAITKME